MTGRRRPDPAIQRSFKTCDAPGCAARVKRGMLMCREHWFQLPRQLREAISTTWQERHSTGINLWSANVLAARGFLAGHDSAAIAARITGDR